MMITAVSAPSFSHRFFAATPAAFISASSCSFSIFLFVFSPSLALFVGLFVVTGFAYSVETRGVNEKPLNKSVPILESVFIHDRDTVIGLDVFLWEEFFTVSTAMKLAFSSRFRVDPIFNEGFLDDSIFWWPLCSA